MSDEELFTRLIYYGTAQLNHSEYEIWIMPIGHLLDLWECHKQFHGMSKPKKDVCIDDIIPMGI